MADIEDSEAHCRRSTGTRQPLQGAHQTTHRQGIPEQDPWKQLWGATGAVFGSWMNDRAIVYRAQVRHPLRVGHGRSTCRPWFIGNTGDTSGSGVAFTRNPANGVKEFYGEFLINAQGEDVVAGVRTPEPVAQACEGADAQAAYKELDMDIRARRWKSTSRTCRTLSSRSRTARCSCSRRATASAPRWPHSSSPCRHGARRKLIDWEDGHPAQSCRST